MDQEVTSLEGDLNNTVSLYDKQSSKRANTEVPSFSHKHNASEIDVEIKEYSSVDELNVSLGKSKEMENSRSEEEVDYIAQCRKKIKKAEQDKRVISWIQCDRVDCQKWRKVDVDVCTLSKEKWECNMNDDPLYDSCNISEEEWSDESEDESVYSEYKPGVIVIAKMPGYPWWPGIIEDDPDYDSFFYLDRKPDKVVVSYHVTFFGKDVSRAWLRQVSVRAFKGDERVDDLGQLSYNRKSFARNLTDALEEAKKAIKISLDRRVIRYGFLGRYKRKRIYDYVTESESDDGENRLFGNDDQDFNPFNDGDDFTPKSSEHPAKQAARRRKEVRSSNHNAVLEAIAEKASQREFLKKKVEKRLENEKKIKKELSKQRRNERRLDKKKMGKCSAPRVNDNYADTSTDDD